MLTDARQLLLILFRYKRTLSHNNNILMLVDSHIRTYLRTFFDGLFCPVLSLILFVSFVPRCCVFMAWTVASHYHCVVIGVLCDFFFVTRPCTRWWPNSAIESDEATSATQKSSGCAVSSGVVLAVGTGSSVCIVFVLFRACWNTQSMTFAPPPCYGIRCVALSIAMSVGLLLLLHEPLRRAQRVCHCFSG